MTLSSRRAIAYAACVLVLAGAVAFGELTVAQLAGIDRNIGTLTANIVGANATLGDVVRKSEPTVRLEREVSQIVTAQRQISTTMRRVNRSLVRMQRSTDRIAATTATMARTNAGVQGSLQRMSADSAQLQTLLAALIPVSQATGQKLARMRTDSSKTNKDLRAIVTKLLGYDLPAAS